MPQEGAAWGVGLSSMEGMGEDDRLVTAIFNYILEKIKKLKYLPVESSIALLLFLAVGLMPQEGSAWGMGFEDGRLVIAMFN